MLLTEDNEQEYTDFLNECESATFTHSLPFRNLLADALSIEQYYVVAKERGEIVGAIPLFLRRSKLGNILNSLPFFGAHGGFLVADKLGDRDKQITKRELFDMVIKVAGMKECVLTTIITPLFDTDITFYEQHIQYKYKDSRTAQITAFPEHVPLSAESEIMYHIVEKRNRASIRKPIKNGVTVVHSMDFNELYMMHEENISKKEGVMKPQAFFHAIPKYMDESEYSLTYAMGRDDKVIAGLLLFYFKGMVEYYCPALYLDCKNEAGLSLLIFNGMMDAMRKGYRYWNWGGIRQSPEKESLYIFKRGWGAKDFGIYYRYTIQQGDITHLLELSKEEILHEYPYFYVMPFGKGKRK